MLLLGVQTLFKSSSRFILLKRFPRSPNWCCTSSKVRSYNELCLPNPPDSARRSCGSPPPFDPITSPNYPLNN
ncbi:hypothetical protein HanRHA438_Chr06g0268431 [Helianthus annuus]|nr:hypothetical protein HanRHA438_Chr06g0268431 [Helianthus annuus]